MCLESTSFLKMSRENPSCRRFQRKNNAIVEEKLLINEKVTTSEEVDKVTKNLDDKK